MTEHLRAYNSLWQIRGDSWCRLEEAADRLTRRTTTGAAKERFTATCRELVHTLSALEPYWAYPGSPQFGRIQRLFAAGSYDKFSQNVARINRALTTESYRSGDVDNAGADELDVFPADPRELEHQPATQRDRPYFEVLVVETMTEAPKSGRRTCRSAAPRRFGARGLAASVAGLQQEIDDDLGHVVERVARHHLETVGTQRRHAQQRRTRSQPAGFGV